MEPDPDEIINRYKTISTKMDVLIRKYNERKSSKNAKKSQDTSQQQ
jgi:hypothetical protein